MTTKYVVAYLRCSGRGQVDGDTWERQEAAVIDYAANNGYVVGRHFRDEGISGKTELEGRGGLADCLAYLQRNGSVKTVIVESADRLARDSLVAEVLIREFQKIGVSIISAAGGVDLTAGDDLNPTAKLIRQILAAIAEFDRCVTVNKLRAARERVKSKNGRCEGQKEYGHYPGEDAILAQIMVLRARGATFGAIADALYALGHRTRKGKRWKSGTIAKIVARTLTADNSTKVGQ